MNLNFRQVEILKIARSQGRVLVDDLAQRFGVTPQTVRKDLNELCEARRLSRVHGGAVLASGVENLGYEARRGIAVEEKRRIGALCARHVPDKASLFINIGTTTEAVAEALRGHQGLLVITNNLNVANILRGVEDISVIIAGGLVRHSDAGVVGEATSEFISRFKVDYAVIGASALDEDGSLLDYDYREVHVARAIIANARETFLVADAQKFDRSAPVRIAHVGQIAAFFTDRPPPAGFAAACAQAGTRIFVADRPEDIPQGPAPRPRAD